MKKLFVACCLAAFAVGCSKPPVTPPSDNGNTTDGGNTTSASADTDFPAGATLVSLNVPKMH